MLGVLYYVGHAQTEEQVDTPVTEAEKPLHPVLQRGDKGCPFDRWIEDLSKSPLREDEKEFGTSAHRKSGEEIVSEMTSGSSQNDREDRGQRQSK